jgi:hypothetical protein
MPPRKVSRPVPAVAGNEPRDDLLGGTISSAVKTTRRSNQVLIASINKSHSTQLRVSLSTWRGQRKVDLADFTSVVPGTYFQSGSGVSLDISKLPELIDALKAAETKAHQLGLLSEAVRP